MVAHQRIVRLMLVVFFKVASLPVTYAQEVIVLPNPGVMVDLSPGYVPPHLIGISVYPNTPLKFDFIINRGDTSLTDQAKKEEYTKLIKYFLASLAVPDENQWVNLSPYEKDRIVGPDFANTQMGRDLLGQDYILKQITSSLIYPEKDLGKDFWDKVYAEAFKQFGNTNIPVNTFNKVWIVPDSAIIYEQGNSAYVLKNHLKVMLEQDYVATKQNAVSDNGSHVVTLNASTSKVMRDVIIPVLEKEVNEGKNFANLRQIYSGMLLAAWYKRVLKESFLAKVYADKSKLKGVDQPDCKQAGIPCASNQEIYQRYLQATKKGVYNFIKEDVDKYTQQIIPRKYFSGGAKGYTNFAMIVQRVAEIPEGMGKTLARENFDVLDINLEPANENMVLETTDFDPFSDNVQDEHARVVAEIEFDPYYADLKDMSKNMKQDIKHLYRYDKTLDKNTRKEMTEILQRIASEVEFDGKKGLVEIYEEIDAKTAHLGDREVTYMGLRFKLMNLTRNSRENLEALGKNADVILQKIIMERAKSRLDHSMSANMRDETIERALRLFRERNIEPEPGYDAKYVINPQMSVYQEFLSFIIDELGRLPFNDEVGKTFEMREDAKRVVTRIKQYLEVQRNQLSISRRWIDMTSQLNNISTEWSEVFKNEIYSGHQRDGVGYNLDLNILRDRDSGAKKLAGFVLERRQVRWNKETKKIEVFDAGFYNLDLRNGNLRMDLDIIETRHVHDHSMTQAKTIDERTLSADAVGGIDFNASHLNMHIKRDGNGLVLPLAQQSWDNIKIEGLIPVIINIKPMQSLPILSQQ